MPAGYEKWTRYLGSGFVIDAMCPEEIRDYQGLKRHIRGKLHAIEFVTPSTFLQIFIFGWDVPCARADPFYQSRIGSMLTVGWASSPQYPPGWENYPKWKYFTLPPPLPPSQVRPWMITSARYGPECMTNAQRAVVRVTRIFRRRLSHKAYDVTSDSGRFQQTSGSKIPPSTRIHCDYAVPRHQS